MKKQFFYASLLFIAFSIATHTVLAQTKSVPSKSSGIKSLPSSLAAAEKKLKPLSNSGQPGSGPQGTNTIIMGSGPNCIGSGLCQKSNSFLNFSYDPVGNTLGIFITAKGLTDQQVQMLQGPQFSFDADWAIPQVDATSQVPAQTIAAGLYPVFLSPPFYVITIQF